MRNLVKSGLFPNHVAFYINIEAQPRKVNHIVNKYFSKRPLLLAVDFEWEANYEPRNHPRHQSGPYRCYGVDVGIYSTGSCTMVVHHGQWNEPLWGRPGPYRAKTKTNAEVGMHTLTLHALTMNTLLFEQEH